MRNPSEEDLSQMDDRLRETVVAAGEAAGVRPDLRELWRSPQVKFDGAWSIVCGTAPMTAASNASTWWSGATHDTHCTALRSGPTAMIFVPCCGGISHNELEHSEPEQVEAAALRTLDPGEVRPPERPKDSPNPFPAHHKKAGPTGPASSIDERARNPACFRERR